ncbi:hypothetical protein Daesc_009780 [Daldinia eschscholtzii]|uniref:Purine permease n=1 Tax=Daldinia eschscholtzii TaxID=292717 RepID=A0AAX6MB94_9PEZI
MDEDQGPSQIVPQHEAKKTSRNRLNGVKKTFLTKQGLVGDYDYGFLLRPNLPFMKRSRQASPFFGLNDKMPVVLAFLLGLQHALAMLAGIITPPILMSGSTGLISVVGISFSIIPVAQGAFAQMYANGFCPTDADGTKLPCPDAYGALLGTAAVCALIEVLIAFIPPSIMLRIFPPIVTGPTVMLIGISLIETGFKNWAGGSGPCADATHAAYFDVCPNVGAPHALPWGSPEYLGLGFSVFLTVILCERFGAPIMKSTSVIIGLLVGCIIAAATGYFDRSGIDAAPVASFVWVHTFKLTVYGPLVLPVLAVFIICACESIGDITATCDVSRLEVEGRTYESRIQGGVLADGLNGILAALMTITPMSTFAQNNGVIALTRCANRTAGYCCW